MWFETWLYQLPSAYPETADGQEDKNFLGKAADKPERHTRSDWIHHMLEDQRIFYTCFYLAMPGYNMPALPCGKQGLITPPGIEPGPPALGMWSLSHWIPREVLPASTHQRLGVAEDVVLQELVQRGEEAVLDECPDDQLVQVMLRHRQALPLSYRPETPCAEARGCST